jgi:hypothetical protein
LPGKTPAGVFVIGPRPVKSNKHRLKVAKYLEQNGMESEEGT